MGSGGSLQYLMRSKGRRIAYHSTEGDSPGLIFCPGFQSNMGGVKALALEEYCRTKGHAFIRFDYLGCGESDGQIRDVTLSDWKEDVLAVLNELTSGPQMIVGSSLGAWLMLLAAVAHPQRIHSLIGVASAPDFNKRNASRFGSDALEELKLKGETLLPSEYGNYVITQRFLDDVDQHNLLDQDSIPLTCPVRLYHGMADRAVPYQVSINVAEKLASENVKLVLRKKGDHRLSEPEDIQILLEQVESLIYGTRNVHPG